MKLSYMSPNGRVKFECDVQTGKTAFEVIAAIQELFEEACCGACKSKEIRCDVREFKGNKYYKMVCLACEAQLDFGQNKDGKGMFPKRYDKENRLMPNRGWYIYQRKAGESW